MDKIKIVHGSKVDHRWLRPGIYVADKYLYTNPTFVVTVLDLRFVRPRDPMEGNYAMSAKAMHTIEHLGTAYLQSLPEWKDRIISFSPMGCRTGFKLILAGNYEISYGSPIHRLVMEMCMFIVEFDGNIPGANSHDCGNCTEHNLSGAKRVTALYLHALFNNPCFTYPVER